MNTCWGRSQVRFYDLDAPVPREAWAVLRRAYGRACAEVARVDEHGGLRADLTDPCHARLLRPAPVRTERRWWLPQFSRSATVTRPQHSNSNTLTTLA